MLLETLPLEVEISSAQYLSPLPSKITEDVSPSPFLLGQIPCPTPFSALSCFLFSDMFNQVTISWGAIFSVVDDLLIYAQIQSVWISDISSEGESHLKFGVSLKHQQLKKLKILRL